MIFKFINPQVFAEDWHTLASTQLDDKLEQTAQDADTAAAAPINWKVESSILRYVEFDFVDNTLLSEWGLAIMELSVVRETADARAGEPEQKWPFYHLGLIY